MKNNLFSKIKIQSNNLSKNSEINLSKRFSKIFLEVKKDVSDNQKTLNVLNKKYKFKFKIKDLKKFRKYKSVAVIGMGGSILGAEAIYNFFHGKIKKKFYFFNDLDEKKIIDFKKNENISKVLFIIISKSGNTLETISNTFSLNIIKKNSKNVILISEKKNNQLFNLSKKFNLFHIEHNKYIGGRFSVLSEVGMIPAYFMGLNIFKIRSNLLDCFKKKNTIFVKDNSIKLAQLILSKKINNLIFLNYFPELEKFLFWCQQLIAESLGKQNKGFLPMISKVPKDHHSLLQLYLDGPKDKLFNIFSFNKRSKEIVKINKDLSNNTFLNKKNLGQIKNAQKNALIKLFLEKKIPYREFVMKKNDEETLGKLFSFFVIETIIVGKLIKINPFNQPAVEEVKIYTKKYLFKNTKNNF